MLRCIKATGKWCKHLVKEVDSYTPVQEVMTCICAHAWDVFRRWLYAAYNEFSLQRPQAILFLPVFLASGIGCYFSLPVEPYWAFAPFFLLLFIAGLFFLPRAGRYCLLALILMLVGFCAAQLRVSMVHTPMLEKAMDFADVEGRVIHIEPLEKGVRILLDNVHIEDIEPEATPRRIRVKVWDGEALRVGHRVKALAGLNPPSSSVIPRGFDFQRYMYFQGIGASGFTYRTPEILEDIVGLRLLDIVQDLRGKVVSNIQDHLQPPLSELAMALLVGQKRAIDESDLDAIRASGLAHMLAISGLHIGLFAGFIFFGARLLMACLPAFALRYPIKKYAAVLAIMGAFFYMLLAGATIPSQRAMITVAVVFSAILLDRSAISLRVVAFAAFTILLFFPESLLSVSFQMSFAAVTCLVAFYDWLRPVWSRLHRRGGVLRRCALYLLGVSITTVVATFATAPFTLFHFQTLAVYGLLANFICVPILAFMIMPCAVIALLSMPFGLEGPALSVMAPALRAMLDIAYNVAHIDGSVLRIPQWSFISLVFVVLSVLSVILLRSHLRIIAACICLVLAFINFQLKQPDIIISLEFDLVAFRSDEQHLLVSSRRTDAFSRDNWEAALGFEPGSSQALPREGVIEGGDFTLFCAEIGCRLERGGYKISYLREVNARGFVEECGWADVIISREDLGDCPYAQVITRWDVYAQGAHSLMLDPEGVRVVRSEDFRGNRPWVQ